MNQNVRAGAGRIDLIRKNSRWPTLAALTGIFGFKPPAIVDAYADQTMFEID